MMDSIGMRTAFRVALVVFCGYVAWAGCNYANAIFSPILSASPSSVSEGETVTVTVTKEDDDGNSVGGSNSWHCAKVGNGHTHWGGFSATNQTTDSIDYVLYWSSEVNSFKVTCTAEGTEQSAGDCVSSTTVTVSIPQIAGTTQCGFSVDVKAVPLDSSDSNGLWKAIGLTNFSSAAAFNEDWKIPTNSPFYAKFFNHELRHKTDFRVVNGSSPAVVEGRSKAQEIALSGSLFSTWAPEEYFVEYSSTLSSNVMNHLDVWTEKNAYEVSDEIWPYCYYQTTNNPKPCGNSRPSE